MTVEANSNAPIAHLTRVRPGAEADCGSASCGSTRLRAGKSVGATPEVMSHLANRVSHLVHVLRSIALQQLHYNPAIESLLRYRTETVWIIAIDTRIERCEGVVRTWKRRPCLEQVVQIYGPSAGNKVCLGVHSFFSEGLRELRRSRGEIVGIYRKQRQKKRVCGAVRDCLERDPMDFRKMLGKSVPHADSRFQNIVQPFQLCEPHSSLHLGHLIVGGEKERITDSFLPLVALIEEQRCNIT